MRVHVFQHVPFEGLGSLAEILASRGDEVTWTRWYEPEPAAPPRGPHWLIVLGGPMSVHDEAALPWLRAEKAALRAALAAGRPVLGLCLGAQLLAEVQGGTVSRNPQREIGWWPVVAEPGAPEWFRALLPPDGQVFHWHGETFALPPDAALLGSSNGCRQQAGAWGERVLALQYHLETTPASAAALVTHCPGDLAPGPFVQTAAELLGAAARYAALRPLADRLVEHFARQVAASA
jgi:GMP synthase-like glutamine amidotransferase